MSRLFEQRNNRLLISQIVPDELVVKLACSQAGNNFCRNLAQAAFDNNITLIPFYVNEKISKNDFGFKITIVQQSILFSKFRWLRKIFSPLFDSLMLVNKIYSAKILNIWFYNVTPQNLLAFLASKYILKKNNFIILADFNPPLKKISIEYLLLYCIRKSHGIIALSHLSNNLIQHKNCTSLQGILNSDSIPQKVSHPLRRNMFLFSGALNEYTGIVLALEAFSKLPEFDLLVTGSGKYASKVASFSKTYNNIKFIGHLEYYPYLTLLDSVDFVLSLRNPHIAGNEFNFPSKIIEYVKYQKIVISTISYVDFNNNNCFICNYNVESLIEQLKEIQTIEEEVFINKKINSQLILNNYSYENWLRVVNEVENG